MNNLRNHTPATYATTQVVGQKRQRNRTSVSCLPCRSRKVACDREQPCNSCVKHKIPDKCQFSRSEMLSEPSTTTPPNTSSSTTTERDTVRSRAPISDDVDDRMDRIESAVENLTSIILGSGPSVRSNDHALLLNANACGATAIGQAVSNPNGSAANQSAPLGTYAEGAIDSKAPDRFFYIGSSGWTIHTFDLGFFSAWDSRKCFAKQWSAFVELTRHFTGKQHRTLLNLYTPLVPPLIADQDLQDLIPDRSTSEVLVRRFFLTFNASHPVFDRFTFEREIDQYWEEPTSKSRTWIVCFLAVLALGYQLPILPLANGATIPKGQAHGKSIMQHVQNVLLSDPQLGPRPSTYTFQTLLLVILSRMLVMDWVDGNDTISGLLGIASRMAFTMGLHRDLRLARDMTTDNARVRRKIFMTLNLIDVEHSMQCGMPYVLRTTDYDFVDESDGPGQDQWYQYHISKALPIWGEALQCFHSRQSHAPTRLVIARLEALAKLLQARAPAPLYSHEEELIWHNISTSVLPAVLEGITHRLLLTIYLVELQDPRSLGSRQLTQQSILASTNTILNRQHKLQQIRTSLSISSKATMEHYLTAMFRCTWIHACISQLTLIKLTFSDDAAKYLPLPASVTAVGLLDPAFRITNFLATSMPISVELVKEHMIWNAFFRSIHERVRIVDAAGGQRVDMGMSSPAASTIVKSMQDAMDESVALAKFKITEAKDVLDPPPVLVRPVDVQGTTDAGPVGGQIVGEDLEQWTVEMDALLGDWDAKWPWSWSGGMTWEEGNTGTLA